MTSTLNNCPPFLLADMVKMMSLLTKLGVNITSYDELFDKSECPILIFTSGNYTNDGDLIKTFPFV